MPGEITREGQKRGLDAASGRVAVAQITTYLCLCTADPGKAPANPGAINEISTAGYARMAVSWTAPSDVDPSRTENASVITFGPFTADPPNVTHAALVTSSSGATGEVRMKWTLDVAKDAAINESIQFAAAALYMTLD